jgi:hypothetical protein
MSIINVSKFVKLTLFPFFLLIFAGCWIPSKPPSIPPNTNAKLPTYSGHRNLSWAISNDYEALVLVYIDNIVKYAQETHGGITDEWYLCKTKKISTIEGIFDEDIVSFVCMKRIGMKDDITSFKYNDRIVLLLGLKTGKKPYEIVSQEQRSWLEPYGKLNKPVDEIQDYDKVIKSILSYQKRIHLDFRRGDKPNYAFIYDKNFVVAGSIEIVEETERYFIITSKIGSSIDNLMVTKTTMDVATLPVPKSE